MGILPEKETFEYDALDCLVSVNTGNTPALNIFYANNGNIMSKTDVGNYTYSSVKPHAVMKIDNADAYQYTSDMTTEYNDMGRIKLIRQRQMIPISLKFTYGADGSLWNRHYIQSQRLGSNYFPVVAEPSFFSALATSKWLGMEHKERWFEVEASELGAKHFDEKYGKGAKGYKSDNPNYFNVEQFWGNSKATYVNPRLGYVYQDKKFRHSGYKFVFWDFFSSIF